MGVKQIAAKHNPYASGYNAIKWTIGAESGGNVINVAGKFVGAAGPLVVSAYLSGAANGLDVVGTAPSGTVAAGTKGKIQDVVGGSKKHFQIITDANGEFDINITEAGAATFYLVVRKPDGTLDISPAITFAA